VTRLAAHGWVISAAAMRLRSLRPRLVDVEICLVAPEPPSSTVDGFPMLAGSPTVQARNPTTIRRVILEGQELPAIGARPDDKPMPPFALCFDPAFALGSTP
jgi:hypothetical protein